ncbi:MAG: hypothetical protein OEM26_16475 [Saprospiraceae bacterium]|nr:hypothetical protein [Saprospiraceae bacterium]
MIWLVFIPFWENDRFPPDMLSQLEAEDGFMRWGSLEQFIQVDFQFDGIRGDARFQELLARIIRRKESIREAVEEYLKSTHLLVKEILEVNKS